MGFRNEEYEGPSESATYLGFKEPGKHQFRFMGLVETYNRYWKNKTPHRYVAESEVPKDVDISDFTKKPSKEHVWAVVAIEKDEKGKPVRSGILTIRQATIQKQLMSLYNDEDYGDFSNYDIVIETKQEAKISYNVTPKPPKPVSKEELDMYEAFEPKDLSKKDSEDDSLRGAVETVDPKELPF